MLGDTESTDTTEGIFTKTGAVLKGHFLLSSGRHSPIYWEKSKVVQFPDYTELLCRMIASHFREQEAQVVAGPTTVGIILAYETAKQLGVRSIFAERESNGERTFRRGFSLDPGERVLIVDDILTTGGSIRGVINAVNNLGGRVIGVGVLVDRSEQPPEFGVPLFSCLRSEVITYATEDCPLCADRIPLVKPGSSA
ncbi:orotate phosphoribosyltransferase [Chloroflexota bacterium]